MRITFDRAWVESDESKQLLGLRKSLGGGFTVNDRPLRNEFAGASAPVTWQEVERGFDIADFRLDNLPSRVRRRGDLWKSRLSAPGRFKLEQLL